MYNGLNLYKNTTYSRHMQEKRDFDLIYALRTSARGVRHAGLG